MPSLYTDSATLAQWPTAERLRALLDPAGDSSNDERRRGDDAPLLGSKLAPQSLGLQSRERDDAALWRLANP